MGQDLRRHIENLDLVTHPLRQDGAAFDPNLNGKAQLDTNVWNGSTMVILCPKDITRGILA